MLEAANPTITWGRICASRSSSVSRGFSLLETKEAFMADPFLGEIRIFAGNFAPRGWAVCNGQLLAISQNTALFSLLGTTYGGDGRTTFGLPNLQGRAPMHQGQGPGLTPRTLGEQAGSQTVTLIANEMVSHNHAMVASTSP